MVATKFLRKNRLREAMELAPAAVMAAVGMHSGHI
jgi:hypothetical protein